MFKISAFKRMEEVGRSWTVAVEVIDLNAPKSEGLRAVARTGSPIFQRVATFADSSLDFLLYPGVVTARRSLLM